MERRAFHKFLLTLVLFTSVSLACESGAFPSLFGPATPTRTPWPTFTPTPTATATLLPTASAPPEGMILERQPDGTTLFHDFNSGLDIRIPASWAAAPANLEAFQTAIDQISAENPEIADAMQGFEALNSEMFRIMAFDTRPEHFQQNYVTNFTVLQVQDAGMASLPMNLIAQITADTLLGQYPSAEIFAIGTIQTRQRLEAGYVGMEMPIKLPDGSIFLAYQKQIYFTYRDYLIVFTFSTSHEQIESMNPLFEEIVDLIRFVD